MLLQIINYSATHPELITRYHASSMVLHMHSDDSLFSSTGAKIRSGGCHYPSSPLVEPNAPPTNQPPLNRLIHVEFPTIKNVLASTMEAYFGSLFVNCWCRAALNINLTEMVHQKPSTPVFADSTTGDVFLNNNARKIRSRYIDMRFYWVHGIVKQGHYLVYW